MNILAKSLLHRVWVPAVVLLTVLVLVPRVIATVRESERVSRAAGVYAWERTSATGPATKFRWTKGRSALREPVRGALLTIPIYLARPDIDSQPVNLLVTVDGSRAEPITLTTNGWRLVTFDLIGLVGEARWKSLRTVTLEFDVRPTVVPHAAGNSSDRRELGVGLAAVEWSGPSPEPQGHDHGYAPRSDAARNRTDAVRARSEPALRAR